MNRVTVKELKRRDTVLAHVLDDIYDGVYIVDSRRQILFWNKGAERITGYRAEEVIGKWCGDNILCHIDEDGALLCRDECPLTETLRTGARFEQKVYPLHKSGRRFPTKTHIAPILDEAGNIIAAIEVFRDISQEEELRLIQEKFRKLIAKYVSHATIEEVTAQARGLEEQRTRVKDLTVLYLDVVGFTAFSEDHTPEDAVTLLNEIFGICEVISTQAHGDIDKFIGDCIMAVFIDANDAVQAAESILTALEQLNVARQDRGLDGIAIRIGINSGMVIQGDVGTSERKDLTVIGDVVNTAARIQTLAKPGKVYVSEATVSRLSEPGCFECAGEAEVKGRKQKIRIFRRSERPAPQANG